MRLLLTGSSGWLGRFLAPLLRAAGHQVTGLDVAQGAHTAIIGSVADRAQIDSAFAEHGIEAVIHAAALHKPDIARHPARDFIAVNVAGTLNLLEAAVAAGNDRFVFTSTTSLMISVAHRVVFSQVDEKARHAPSMAVDCRGQSTPFHPDGRKERYIKNLERATRCNLIARSRAGTAAKAAWLTEDHGPLAPRNIYGVTKLAAEQLCRLCHEEHGLAVTVLRTGRFFPEEDDTNRDLSGPNIKANEFLNRRLTVEDAAAAHLAALDRTPAHGFGTFIVAAPPPFAEADCAELACDAPAVIARYFPQAAELYAHAGWTLPDRIDRVYVPAEAERRLGFRCRTDFAAVLDAMAQGRPLPFVHDPSYLSPKEERRS